MIGSYIFLTLWTSCNLAMLNGQLTTGEENDVCSAKVDNFVTQTKLDTIIANQNQDKVTSLPLNCQEILKLKPSSDSGIYMIYNPIDDNKKQVYCDMKTNGGGWMVIQRRQDGNVNFNRTWEDYRYGFGDLNGEFWLGNELVYRHTNFKKHELRVELLNWQNETAFANYGRFRINSHDEFFKLTVDGYSGTAGNSLNSRHSGFSFSTFDEEHDTGSVVHCSRSSGGGWWFSDCEDSSLNGLYATDGVAPGKFFGLSWDTFGGESYSQKGSEMKMRPVM